MDRVALNATVTVGRVGNHVHTGTLRTEFGCPGAVLYLSHEAGHATGAPPVENEGRSIRRPRPTRRPPDRPTVDRPRASAKTCDLHFLPCSESAPRRRRSRPRNGAPRRSRCRGAGMTLASARVTFRVVSGPVTCGDAGPSSGWSGASMSGRGGRSGSATPGAREGARMTRTPVSDEAWHRTLVDAGLVPRAPAPPRPWAYCQVCHHVVPLTRVRWWWESPNSLRGFGRAGGPNAAPARSHGSATVVGKVER
jgi:hypothetical protein